MNTLRIERGSSAEAGEIFLYQGEYWQQEVFRVSAALTEQELQRLGYRPLEDFFPGQIIEGYAELGEPLYATTWE